MEKLKFLETMTVEEFKSKMSVNKIEVKQNPYTGVRSSSMVKLLILSFHKYAHLIRVTCSICSIRKGMEEHQRWLLYDAGQ